MEQPDQSKITIDAISSGMNKLGMSLLENFDTKENCLFSPFSIGLLLYMLLPATRGETQDEVCTSLGVASCTGETIQTVQALMKNLCSNHDANKGVVSVFNGLFAGRDGWTVKPEFVQLLRDSFQAEWNFLDFTDSKSSSDLINHHVSKATHGLIQQLVSPQSIDPETTCLILLNAIHLLAVWADPFEKRLTREQDFYLSPEKNLKSVKVSMMHRNLDYSCFEDTKDRFKAVSVMLDKNVAFQIFLPEIGSFDATIEAMVTGFDTNKIPGDVELALPKFTIQSSFELKETLQALGLRMIFSVDESDFTSLTTDTDEIAVNELIHKAKIKVDEEGVEAAAASYAECCNFGGLFSSEPERVEFIVNRPFIFRIVEVETRIVLFCGVVRKPISE